MAEWIAVGESAYNVDGHEDLVFIGVSNLGTADDAWLDSVAWMALTPNETLKFIQRLLSAHDRATTITPHPRHPSDRPFQLVRLNVANASSDGVTCDTNDCEE